MAPHYPTMALLHSILESTAFYHSYALLYLTLH